MANPAWQPNTNFAAYAVIIDANGNVQQCTTPGLSGLTTPQWAALAIGTSTVDGAAIWTLVAILAAPAPPATPAPTLPPPQFVNDADGLSASSVLASMIALFESPDYADRTLYPAQVERILIDLYAYREVLLRNNIQYAGEQNLLAFAEFPAIDYLGELLGVKRLAAQPATTTLQFTLADALAADFTIEAGTAVGSSDGQFQFVTVSDLVIPAGSTVGSVGAQCSTPGPLANGYLAGSINVLLQENALISDVTNTTTSADGTAPQTTEQLRTVIQAAPNRFSNAGPGGAYRFFALDTDPSIVDVLVTQPVPGTVNVTILTGPITVQPAPAPNSAGIASAGLISKVLAALSADEVRPLTDTVNVLAVTEVDYVIAGTVYLYADADLTSTMAAVNAAAQQFAIKLASRIQRDIVPEEIIAVLGSVPGVYRFVPTSPVYTPLTTGQWANCTAINLTQAVSTERS